MNIGQVLFVASIFLLGFAIYALIQPGWPPVLLDRAGREQRLQFLLAHNDFEKGADECETLYQSIKESSFKILEPDITRVRGVATARDGEAASPPAFDMAYYFIPKSRVMAVDREWPSMNMLPVDPHGVALRATTNEEFYNLSAYYHHPLWGYTGEGLRPVCDEKYKGFCEDHSGCTIGLEPPLCRSVEADERGMTAVFEPDAKLVRFASLRPHRVMCWEEGDMALACPFEKKRARNAGQAIQFDARETPSFSAFIEINGKPFMLTMDIRQSWDTLRQITKGGDNSQFLGTVIDIEAVDDPESTALPLHCRFKSK